MFLIIASHIVVGSEVCDTFVYSNSMKIINSFYVPLFFILSGIFEKNGVELKQLSRRVLKLIKYSIYFYLFGVLSYWIIKKELHLIHFVKTIPVIWFIFTLIWICISFNIIKFFKKRSVQILAITVACLCGLYLSAKGRSFLYLGQALTCLPFYSFGFYMKNYLKETEFRITHLTIFFILWFIPYFLFYQEQNISLNHITQNYLAFYMEAIFGSLFVIESCKLINWNIISYYGRNTIIPLLVQFAIIYCIYYKINNLTLYLVTL